MRFAPNPSAFLLSVGDIMCCVIQGLTRNALVVVFARVNPIFPPLFSASVTAIVAVLATTNRTSDHTSTSTSGTAMQALPTRPVFKVHPVLGALRSVGSPVDGDTTVEHHSFHTDMATETHHTHLHYEADVVKDTHMLDGNLAALAVTCNSTGIAVQFNSSAEAATFAATLNPHSTLLPLLAEWGCDGGAAVRRTAAAAVHDGGLTVHVATTNATVQHLFKHATISYNGTNVPGVLASKRRHGYGYQEPYDHDDDHDHHDYDDHGRKARSFWSDLTGLWDTVRSDLTTAMADLDTVVKDAEFVEKVLASGNLSYSDEPWSKSFDQSAPCGTGEVGALTTCAWAYDAELTFQISIVNYEVELVELKMTGDVHAGISAGAQPITHSWDGSTSLPGFDKQLFATTIMIGPIPLPLALHGKMQNKFNWQVDGSLNLDGDINVAGDLDLGMRYTPAGFTPILEHTLNGDAAINYATGSLTAKGTITSTTSLLFTAIYCASLSANLVVSPAISATGTETIEGAAATFSDAGGPSDFVVNKIPPSDPSYGSDCHPVSGSSGAVDTPSLQMGVAVGVDLSAAAKIDIEAGTRIIYDHTWPLPGYSNLFNVAQYCIHPEL